MSGIAAFSFRCLPHWGRGTAQRRSGALVNDALETIFFALFHPASTLSGSLRSPPSPRGEGFVSGIPLPHPTSAPSGHLLSKEGGGIHTSPFPWKGLTSAARRGWLPQQVEKEWKEAFPRFVIPSAAEGSFSFPVSVFFRNAVCMKHRPSDSLDARCFQLAAILTSFA